MNPLKNPVGSNAEGKLNCINAVVITQKIVTDVTCIKHNGKWYYLAGYLDLFNNERLVRKLKGKPPVLFRTEPVA